MMVRTHFGQHGDDCFGCKLQSLNFGFVEGKEAFHGPTIRERQTQIVSDAKARGLDPVPVGHKPYAGR